MPQKGAPEMNSKIAQATQTTTMAMRRHSGRKNGCSWSFNLIEPRSGLRKTLRLDRIACRRHNAHQFLVADLGHLQGRVLLRILLGLDDEPALISIAGEFLHDGAEVE